MTVTPLAIAIAGLALMGTVLGLAQRFGNYQNKQLARYLNIFAAGLFVIWCFLLFPSWVGWASAVVLSSVCVWFLRTWTLELTDRNGSHLHGDTPTNTGITGVDTKHTKLVIHSAWYGAKGKYFEVASKLRSEVTSNSLDIIVSFGRGLPQPARFPRTQVD